MKKKKTCCPPAALGHEVATSARSIGSGLRLPQPIPRGYWGRPLPPRSPSGRCVGMGVREAVASGGVRAQVARSLAPAVRAFDEEVHTFVGGAGPLRIRPRPAAHFTRCPNVWLGRSRPPRRCPASPHALTGASPRHAPGPSPPCLPGILRYETLSNRSDAPRFLPDNSLCCDPQIAYTLELQGRKYLAPHNPYMAMFLAPAADLDQVSPPPPQSPSRVRTRVRVPPGVGDGRRGRWGPGPRLTAGG